MPGPFDDLIPQGKAPPQRGYIPGVPKPRDPLDDATKNQQLINQQQALINSQLEEENKRLKNKSDAARFEATGGVDGTEGENKAAALTTNLQSAMNNIRAVTKTNPDAAKPTWLEIGAGVFGPDAREMVQSETRRDVAGDQFIAIDSALTLATGAAYTPSQLEGYARSLFPTVSDSPYNIAQKRRKFQQIIEAGRLQAGAKAPNIEQAIAAVDAIYGPAEGEKQDFGIVVDPSKANDDGVIVNPAPNAARTGGLPTGTDVRFGFQGGEEGFDRTAYLESIGLDPNKEANLMAGLNALSGKPDLTAEDMLKVYADIGAPLPDAAAFQQQLDYARKGYRFGPVDSSVAEADYNKKVADESAGMDASLGEAGSSELAQQGMMIGLGDEAAGVGRGLSKLLQGENPIEGYKLGRDAQRLRLEQAREREGALGTAAEIAGGGASFGTAALTSTVPQTARQLVNSGALQGTLSGFGYGEGAVGSAVGAVGGAALGATATYGLTKGAQFVGSRIGAKNARLAPLRDVAAAADAEGITLPRAMLDPKAGVKATALDSTMAGRPVVDKVMKGVSEAVEGRVGDLSAGNVIPEGENVGNLVRSAAVRSIKDSGAAANRAYAKAENLAGNAKVAPTNALASIKGAIDELSETAGMNSPEINFLKTLEADFSKDLSVGALRRARTKMRKLISKGELTFGESEARVQGIMESAADDIRSGLSAQGKADAARAFDVADKGYRERMEYINGTLQKLIGRRQDNFSGEAIAKKLAAMRGKGGDAEGLRKFFTTLDPDEKADIAATVADGLGKNRKGEFSLAYLASNIENLPESARKTIFGADGAKSLATLKTIATSFDKVKRNTSNTGIGNDWRSILGNVVLGGGAGALGSGSGGAVAGAAALGGAKLGRDYVSARLAMSPKFQRWLSKAVVARTPQQIAGSFRGLSRIAATEPAIAGEVNSLSNYLLQAANDPGPMSAAANSDRKEPSRSSQTARTTAAPQ